MRLTIGDELADGSIVILDEDRLCYSVRSSAKGAVGVRTISKTLLQEWVDALSANPQMGSKDIRDMLCGHSAIDRFEYGYNATLQKMSEMVLEKVPVVHHAPGLVFPVHTSGQGSLQRITYGAPGTGKSWGIEELVKNVPDQVVRTTFHPDSDYSTFVGAYKPTMKDVKRTYVNEGVEKDVVDGEGHPVLEKKIVYDFVEQAFTKAYIKAWRAQDAALAANQPIGETVYLVIEEINRGNCAQAFGDIFQLLDRDERGYSKYPVDADQDLALHLKEAFAGAEDGGRGATALPPEIADGTKLRLPPNLCIWATMNTSDQSLFPMDSAFKRRWDWEYKPIIDGQKDWFVQVNVPEKKDGQGQNTEPAKTLKYDWWKFLDTINAKIYNLTDSEDKELGYYFVKADADQVISAETFVGKVIFYLWNDVYKDYGIAEIFKGEQNGESAEEKKVKGVPFRKFYDDSDPEGKKINVDTLVNFFKAVGVAPES